MSVPAKHKSSNPYAKKKQAHIDDVRAGGAGEGGGSAGAGAAGGAKKGSFKIVHIPCEVADAMTEWVVDMPEGQETYPRARSGGCPGCSAPSRTAGLR